MSGIDQAIEDQWHVQVEQGDVRLWTLDQLDAAFKAELVDESTFVLEVGKTEWMQLGTLLGGGDDEEDEQPAAQAAPAPSRPIAPVIFSEPPMSMGPYSTAPMAADIDDDSPASFRPSRKAPKVIGFSVALLAIAGAALVFTRAGSAPEPPVAPVAAAVAPPPAPPPPVAETKPAEDTSASLAARLTADQRQKLAEADKAHEAKVAAQQKMRAAAAPHHRGKASKEKNPFHNGGEKGDPLNAKL